MQPILRPKIKRLKLPLKRRRARNQNRQHIPSSPINLSIYPIMNSPQIGLGQLLR
jgi:hypothetical protein